MAVKFTALLESFWDKTLGIMPDLGVQVNGGDINHDLGAFGNKRAVQVNVLLGVSGHQVVYGSISSQILLDHHVDIVELLQVFQGGHHIPRIVAQNVQNLLASLLLYVLQGKARSVYVIYTTHDDGLPCAWPIDTGRMQACWQWYRGQPKRRWPYCAIKEMRYTFLLLQC